MSLRHRAAVMLAISVVSVAAIAVLVSLLASQHQVVRVPVPTAKIAQRQEVREFPDNFGRLDALVPFAGGIAPLASQVVPVEHAPEFRDSSWLLSQNPESFTIQVFASQDEQAVKRFLAGRDDRARFVYFLYPQNGANWFVVTTGSFATHELAAGVAGDNAFSGLDGNAFPRRMGAYQEALRSGPPEATQAPASSGEPSPEAGR